MSLELGAIVAASLSGSSWAARSDVVATILASERLGPTRLEASVRRDDRRCEGGRMMIERVRPALAGEVARGLGVPLGEQDQALLAWAAERELPAIAGWDVSRTRPVAKLYVNASDTSVPVRRSLGELVGEALGSLAPHVVGVNLSADGYRELKVYEQLAEAPPETPAAMRRWATGAPIAGWVRSLERGSAPSPTTRAVFAALHPTPEAPELASLPGWSPGCLAALPFPIGFAKSVGFDASGTRWVAYVKPRGARPAGHALEPALCLASPGLEIGIHLEPPEAPAYVRTRDWSLSYRIREGQPQRDAIGAAMAWAEAQVREAEETGRAPSWSAPPAPWSVVDG